MTRTLVVHTGGIGDFLLACPAIRYLAESGPVTIAGIPERARLAADIAEEIVDLDRAGFSSLFSTPNDTLRAFAKQFDRGVVWMRDSDGSIERGLKECGMSDVRVYPGLPPDSWTRHASAYYLECAGGSGEASHQLRVDAPKHEKVLIHCGSGGNRKNWPLERFQFVAEQLAETGYSVVWSRGPAEESLRLPPDCAELPPMSLHDLARWLAGAAGYLGNDSGITHLAAAVGCPVVAVFGPTDPNIWGPKGGHVQIVSGVPWPQSEDVFAVCKVTFRRPAPHTD